MRPAPVIQWVGSLGTANRPVYRRWWSVLGLGTSNAIGPVALDGRAVHPPPLAFLAIPVSAFAGAWFGGGLGLLAVIGLWCTPPVRRGMTLMRVISEASRTEARSDVGDRWETARQ